MNSLLIVFGVVLCFLNVDTYHTPPPDFNVAQLAGDWYELALATSKKWLFDYKSQVKMGVVKFKPTANGNLNVSYARLRDDGVCYRYAKRAFKTPLPNAFTYDSDFMGYNAILLAVVVEKEHIFVSFQMTKFTEVFYVVGLLARKQEPTQTQERDFMNFARNAGFHTYSIHFFKKHDPCPYSKYHQ